MELPDLLVACYAAAVAAADPRRAVAVAMERRRLTARRPVTVLGLGKAAAAMAQGVADLVGEVVGVVVTDADADVPDGIRLVVGGHPVPTAASLVGGAALVDAAAGVGPEGLAVVLVSGGGSALAEVPAPRVSLDDLRRTNELLLRSGAAIGDVNTVRTHLSALKGGGLAAALAGVESVTLIVSDVVGDPVEVIASGPMSAPTGTQADALGVLDRLRLTEAVPPAVIAGLRSGMRPPRATGADIEVVLGGAAAAEAACAHARGAGWDAAVIDTSLTGEAAVVAERLVTMPGLPSIAVFAGETTVTVSGDGRGGRNHEAALAAAIAIDGDPDLSFLAAGTDGVDGDSGGAGAVVDGASAAIARRLGVDAGDHLGRHDSGGFFDIVPGRLVTGPTGTNVGDVWLVGRRSGAPPG